MKPANYAPVYAGLYPELAEIARKHGYAMAVHGSFARDADLICIPWTDIASDPQAIVDEITTTFVIRSVGEPSLREHARVVYSLTIAAPSCFIDLSFTPRTTLAPVPQEATGGHVTIEHDGFSGDIIGRYITREGKRGVVVQQDGTRVVHVYGEKWIPVAIRRTEPTASGEWREVEIKHLPKGRRRSPAYFPATGEACEVSGPNCDDANGYTWSKTNVLWQNDLFVLYGTDGFWPVLHKHEHVLFRPLRAALSAERPTPAGEGEWQPIETWPSAVTYLACYFHTGHGEWVYDLLTGSPEGRPFTHWRYLPATPAITTQQAERNTTGGE